MAIGDISPGYMGLADIDGTKVRCTDFNINAKQEPLFYDHILGLRDSTPSGIWGGKGDTGELNPQKIIWRPSVKIYQGSISFPLTSETGSPLFSLAKTGDEFDLGFKYACSGIARSYTGCRVNSYTFSITAGDFAIVTAEVMALLGEDEGGSGSLYTEVEKIVTWDDVKITGDIADLPIQAFTVSINNNCKPIYTSGANKSLDLNPAKIRVGMQSVEGVISYYNKGVSLAFLEDTDGASMIGISTTDGLDIDLNVIFKPQERSGSISPVISPLPFVGVDQALGA